MLFERLDNQLKRYRIGRGKLVVEEAVTLPPAVIGQYTLDAASDSQILLLQTHTSNIVDRRSIVFAFPSQQLSRQFMIAVPDLIRCMVRDPKRNRVIMGSLNTLWFWYPGDGRLLSQPFLKSAPAIEALALHPNGKTLAILCGGKGSNPSLYWLDLSSEPTPHSSTRK